MHVEFYFRGIVLTDKCFIYKTGIIGVNTQEQLLKQTDTVEIDQSVLGWIFDYATIKLTTTSSSKVSVGCLADPRSVKSSIENLL